MINAKQLKPGLIVATLLLIRSILVLVTAYTFSNASGLFPRFIGWIFVGLTSIEFFLQLKMQVVKTHGEDRERDAEQRAHGEKKDILKEIRGFTWLSLLLVLLYLFGFLISVPVYILAFLRIAAERPWKDSIIISASATLFVYLVFVVLLEYRLFAGIVFGA
jgi:hypothetical protein